MIKKIILHFFVFFVLLLTAKPIFADDAVFSGGVGTELDPYQISNCNQLQAMKDYLSSSFVLNNDIDCSMTSGWNDGAGFEPIGDEENPFSGTLNGNNKVVSGLFMNWESQYVGLFSYLSGDVYDLTLENIDYTGTDYLGGLAGEQKKTSTISNVHVSGSLGQGYANGGLIGRALGNILDSSTDITLVSYEYSGGLVGVLEGEEGSRATISNSSSSGTVEGEPLNIGGLVGLANEYSDISYSHSNAMVNGWAWGMGGLVGRTSGTVTDSYATGDVSSYYGFGIGGLIGKMVGETARVERSYATGNVTAQNASAPNVNDIPTSFAGGLVGYSDAGGVYESLLRAMFWGLVGEWADLLGELLAL